MTLVETTLWLPPNVVDVYITDVDGDGEVDVVVAAKGSGAKIPAPIELFVYQFRDDTWRKTKQIPLGQQAMFWEADRGLWAIDAKGVLDLWSGARVVSVSTWLSGLHQTSPKSADIVHDLDNDGKVEWIVHSGASVSMYEGTELVLSSSQPVNGSIRQYTKTGGIQLEIAQRAKPVVFADWTGDGIQELWWLDGKQASVQQVDSGVTIDLPINVDPQYTTKPVRELSWIQYKDVNGDGYTDMVWQYWVRGESWFGSTSEIGWSLSDGISFQPTETLAVKKAIFDVRLDDVDGDGDLDLWLLGTDLGIASLSKTLLTQEGNATLSVHRFNGSSFSKSVSAEWDVSIPIGQDDAFDYQLIPDHNSDAIVDLAVLLAEKVQIYTSTSDSWRLSEELRLPNRGNWIIANHSDSNKWLSIWSVGRPTITMLYINP